MHPVRGPDAGAADAVSDRCCRLRRACGISEDRKEPAVKSCCEHFADTLPNGCLQGRDCPERTRSTQEAEYLWLRDCARSGQGDLRQIAAHIAAGELDVGYEAA